MGQAKEARHEASHFLPRVGVLWEGHMSDPRRDRAHAHSRASSMAIWRSVPGVCMMLVLGARREVSGSVWSVRAIAPLTGFIYVVFPACTLSSSLLLLRYVSSLVSRRFSRTHVCIVLPSV
jgi:hypothetical protein